MIKISLISVILAAFVGFSAIADDEPGQNTVPANAVTSKAYVDFQISQKQPILNAEGTDLTNNVVMYTDEAGTVEAKPISNTLTGNNIGDNLPTVGAVNTGLAGKQANIPAGTTAGNVVTYSGNEGQVGEKAVYNASASYNANALVQANHVNDAIQQGLNSHLTCVTSDKDPATNQCWVYEINTQAANTVYTAHAN